MHIILAWEICPRRQNSDRNHSGETGAVQYLFPRLKSCGSIEAYQAPLSLQMASAISAAEKLRLH